RDPPGLYRATIGVSDGGCLGLFPALGERRVNVVFFDPGGGIAALTEILLFGAVAHHAGMLRRFLAGIVGRCLGIGFVAHFELSRRGCARHNFETTVRVPRSMPPAWHQPCSFCAVSAITRP